MLAAVGQRVPIEHQHMKISEPGVSRRWQSEFVADAPICWCSMTPPAWLRPKQSDLVPRKEQFRSRFHHPLSHCCPTTIFLDPRNRHRHHLSATLLDGRAGNGETAGPGCYDAVAIARAAGFRMLVMSRIPHAAIVSQPSRSRPKRDRPRNSPYRVVSRPRVLLPLLFCKGSLGISSQAAHR